MKKLILITFILTTSLSYTQENYYSKYDWSETPQKLSPVVADTSEDQLVLFEKRSIEFKNEENQSFQYVLTHVITQLNTDAAIEDNNKMYVTNEYGDVVLVQKARVIKPNGTVLVLKESDIKESKDENGDVEYRYFALEGLEKGCVIEYLHYLKQYPDFKGRSMHLQNGFNKLKVEYDIISPDYLDMLIYPINGMPAFERDTIRTDVRRQYMYTDSVKALKNEYQCPYTALIQKCYYKLNRNFNSGKANFYNYTSAAKLLHESMYSQPTKSAQKKMKELIKEMESKGGSSLEDRVRYLEYKIKSEINQVEAGSDDMMDIDYIIKNKITTSTGLTKLFLQTLREAGIKFELVLTSDRDQNPFISEFEGYNFLDEYLVYIHELDKFWSPNLMSRLGFPPYETTYNKGLFIEEKKLNELFVPIAKVKEIKLTKAEESLDMINSWVDFTVSMNEPKIEIERQVSGYKALYPQAILDLLEDQRKNEFKEDVLKYINEDAKLENISYQNDNSLAAGKLPFSAKASFVGANFIENAGAKTLLKVGMLIGPQAELYNKEKRTLPVQAEFTREYKRTIKIKIPEDIVIKNPDELTMNVKTADNSTGFISSYKMEGNELVVSIHEYYNKVYYTVEEYAGYESVFNAAADFNKLVLVLEKK